MPANQIFKDNKSTDESQVLTTPKPVLDEPKRRGSKFGNEDLFENDMLSQISKAIPENTDRRFTIQEEKEENEQDDKSSSNDDW